MGVRGLQSLLSNHGITKEAPDPRAIPHLWHEIAVDEDAKQHDIPPLPTNSILHIDGNGLAFHLFKIAYAEHFLTVAKKKKRLSSRQIRSVLPNIGLPLDTLTSKVRKFLVAVHGNKKAMTKRNTLKVYWDGSLRRTLKQDTDTKRQDRRDQEWEALHDYCESGNTNPPISWYDTLLAYPKNRLVMIDHVKYLLTKEGKAEHVYCDEEADPIIAKNAAGKDNHFVVASDSDFFLYNDINYLPLTEFCCGEEEDGDGKTTILVQCPVFRRDTLAHMLGLSQGDMMIELALLLGNDYVTDPSSQLVVTDLPTKPKSILKHLRSLVQDDNTFRVRGSSSEDEEALSFVRRLYNHDEMAQYPLVQQVPNTDHPLRPHASQELILDDLKFRAIDTCVLDAVVRVLNDYRSSKDEEQSLVSQVHMNAFLDVANGKRTEKETKKKDWRPIFADCVAAYLIESAISYCFSINRESELVAISKTTPSPALLFQACIFHEILWEAREAKQTTSTTMQDDNTAMENQATTGNEEPIRTQTKTSTPCKSLPIDKHQQEILDNIRRNRITIIQGETGCGKSTRIPCMIMKAPAPHPLLPKVRMFMSQPRRLAAKSLVERIRNTEPELKDKIALRMGHGVKEYETKESTAFFTTTGYLVRYLANSFEAFRGVTHLVIDEVHERSVDTDILCLMCKRLLRHNSSIRLILMSATLAADLYREYFDILELPLKVGARRFPVEEIFIEDAAETLSLSPGDKRVIAQIVEKCDKMNNLTTPSAHHMENVNKIVAKIALSVGEAGRSILVFVPGMNDILALSECFENLAKPLGVDVINCYPIHSDIPFEDQMKIFDDVLPKELRVFLATNSAESSITLPDVDNVICLGLCKQIVYNEASHRQMLMPTWISKASATQRSGRTGRVRPGRVFRMYTKQLFQRFSSFEPGEMVRIPLDSVILMLKDNMLKDDPVTETLLECLEPPDVSNIQRSFDSLFASKFITDPDDTCEVTELGQFVSHLGVDLALGGLLGLGIQFGVGAEAVQMVACLSFPQSPWKIPNPMIQKISDFNRIAVDSFRSKCKFDDDLFSEPLAAMNLIWQYDRVKKKGAWCHNNGVHETRVRRLLLTCNNLRRRVASYCSVKPESLELTGPPSQLPRGKLTILRIIQVWVFCDTLIECNAEKFSQGLSKDNMNVDFSEDSEKISEEQLKQVLNPKHYPFQLRSNIEFHQKGNFKLNCEFNEFVSNLDKRLSSFFQDKFFDLCWVCVDSLMMVLVKSSFLENNGTTLETDIASTLNNHAILQMNETSNKRGIGERPCGKWVYQKSDLVLPCTAKRNEICLFYGSLVKKDRNVLEKCFNVLIKASAGGVKGFCCHFTEASSTKTGHGMNLHVFGAPKLTENDIRDLLSAVDVKISTCKGREGVQTVVFPRKHEFNEETFKNRLFDCIPEGARLLACLASARRKEHSILVPCSTQKNKSEACEDDVVRVTPNRKQTVISRRWRRFNTDSNVYTSENSVVATAVPTTSPKVLYCCCANTLEVKGGGLKVEGLTLLPPGRLFLMLCKLSFGLDTSNKDNDGNVKMCVDWVQETDLGVKKKSAARKDWEARANAALDFHEDCKMMGEGLVCFPDKVKKLLSIFDGLDGFKVPYWASDGEIEVFAASRKR